MEQNSWRVSYSSSECTVLVASSECTVLVEVFGFLSMFKYNAFPVRA